MTYTMLKMIVTWTVHACSTKDQLIFVMAYSSMWYQYNLASVHVLLHFNLLQQKLFANSSVIKGIYTCYLQYLFSLVGREVLHTSGA